MIKLNSKHIIEQLADLEHRQWIEWTKYMLKNTNQSNIEKWKLLTKTKYKDLTEKQKWSDRRWANKTIQLISKIIKNA